MNRIGEVTNPDDQLLPITARALLEEVAGHLVRLDRIIGRLEADLAPGPRLVPVPRAGGGTGSDLARLTERERQVLGLLVEGLSNRRIARALHISEPTVKNHLHSIFLKLGVTDRTQAIAKILRGEPLFAHKP
jgi:DNA-binding NarL/FixJ family response regulator